MSDGKRVHGCSFDLHEGEVLALAGLVGSGRTELARLIFGADAAHRRRRATRRQADRASARRARRSTPASLYLTEDRKELGLFLDMSIADNISMGVLGRRRAGRRLARLRQRPKARAAEAVSELSHPHAGRRRPMSARCRAATSRRCCSPACSRPSRGCSSSTSRPAASMSAPSREIYRLIDDLASKGIAIL